MASYVALPLGSIGAIEQNRISMVQWLEARKVRSILNSVIAFSTDIKNRTLGDEAIERNLEPLPFRCPIPFCRY